jgi:aquaporin Z
LLARRSLPTITHGVAATWSSMSSGQRAGNPPGVSPPYSIPVSRTASLIGAEDSLRTPSSRRGVPGNLLALFGGCGSAVLAAEFLSAPNNVQLGIGFLGVALGFGLTVLTGACAFGHVSGGHLNRPSRSAWRSPGGSSEERPALHPHQIVAASAAGAILFAIAVGKAGATATTVQAGGFASNGYGDRSPGKFDLISCLIIEVLLTAVFVYVILGATDDRAPKGFAPLAIGLALTIIHLASIPVTNTRRSTRPVRSGSLIRWRWGPQPGLAIHRCPDHRRGHRRCEAPPELWRHRL